MLIQWLLIMVCYAGPEDLNRGELCCASGCESWCVMLSQWLLFTVCYAVPVVLNHSEL